MTPGQRDPRPTGFEMLPPAMFRELRKSRGLSQKRLARAARITAETLCRWEKGREPIPPRCRLVLWLLLTLPAALDIAEAGA